MKSQTKSRRVAVGIGLLLATIPVLGAASPGLAASPPDEQIDGGAMESTDRTLDVNPMYNPGPGNGYAVNSDYPFPASYFPWEIKLTPEAERAGLRSVAQSAAQDFVTATGVQMTVAAGTVPYGYSLEREEILLHSGTDYWGQTPEAPWSGAAKPTRVESNDLGYYWIEGGKVLINPSANGRGAAYLREIISHEIGHVFGLAHYEPMFEGSYQVMKKAQRSGPGYKSGDRNGLLNALNRSKNRVLDSSIPGLVIADGESIDFNGDGTTDVFGRDAYGGWRYSSGGKGGWQGLSRSDAEYQDLRFGDFNKDGFTDVFTAVWNGRTYQWKVRYVRPGEVKPWVNLFNSPIPLDQLRFGDFDGDQQTDVFTATWTGKTYQWKYSSGGVSNWKNLAAAGNPIDQLRFGNFDGDKQGTTDVFIAQKEGNGYRWKYSAGGAKPWTNLAFSGAPLAQLRFGDFNGDQRTDVFTAAWTGKTYQWKYSSGGKENWTNLAIAGNPLDQLRFGNFDGDKQRTTDVFSRGYYNNRWYWQYSVSGKGGWTRGAQANDALDQLRIS